MGREERQRHSQGVGTQWRSFGDVGGGSGGGLESVCVGEGRGRRMLRAGGREGDRTGEGERREWLSSFVCSLLE